MGNCQSGVCMRVSMREGYVLDCINGFHTSLRNETSYCEHMSVLQLDALKASSSKALASEYTGCGS